MERFLLIILSVFIITDALRPEVFYESQLEAESKKDVSMIYSSEDILGIKCSEPVCEGALADIYCRGDILATAWYYNLQNVCPGTRLRVPVEEVQTNFQRLKKPVSFEMFQQFCSENFLLVPYLEVAKIPDWNPAPALFAHIKDRKMLFLADFINKQWPLLSRKFIDDVLLNQTQYPVVPVPHPFFVPGGRFQVYFYWDSYWILKGLLASDMTKSALDILLNFAHTVKHNGFIPNSGQIQLSRRSQPPFFTQMVSDYFEKTKNTSFLKMVLPVLKKEMQFWKRNKTVTITVDGRKHLFYQYRAISNCPRPESFIVDVVAAKEQKSLPNEVVWSSLASACESGLDFTSRWFGTPRNRNGVRTNLIIPVDLNVFIVQNLRLIAKWSQLFGHQKEAANYRIEATMLSNSINNVLYDKNKGAWFDFDTQTHLMRPAFYPSNVFPLLINSNNKNLCDLAIKYLEEMDVLKYSGGIPSSLHNHSNEQWDFPNTWAPSTHLFVESLSTCPEGHKAQFYAKITAEKFLKNVYESAKRYGKIWEKYDVRFDDGRSGGGGEYPPQYGFGWTNGAALEFIRLFYTNESINIPLISLNIVESYHGADTEEATANVSIILMLCCLIVVLYLVVINFKSVKGFTEELLPLIPAMLCLLY